MAVVGARLSQAIRLQEAASSAYDFVTEELQNMKSWLKGLGHFGYFCIFICLVFPAILILPDNAQQKLWASEAFICI